MLIVTKSFLFYIWMVCKLVSSFTFHHHFFGLNLDYSNSFLTSNFFSLINRLIFLETMLCMSLPIQWLSDILRRKSKTFSQALCFSLLPCMIPLFHTVLLLLAPRNCKLLPLNSSSCYSPCPAFPPLLTKSSALSVTNSSPLNCLPH